MSKKIIHKPYAVSSHRLDRTIHALLKRSGSVEDEDILAQMVTTVLKVQHESVDRGDLKMLNSTLKELRWAFRVFRPYRHIRKVTIFGSARTKMKDPNFKSADQFSKLMAETGWMIITGASSGIMHAGNKGAGQTMSFGANIRLPFEQDVNPVMRGDKKLIHFKYFFTRKLIFVRESSAIALFPGGFGTLDEGYEAMTLVQTGKTQPTPIVLIESSRSRYWESFMEFVKRSLLGRRMISPEDLHLFHIAKSPKQARDLVVQFYKNYHSVRYVGDRMVMRLQKPLSPLDLKILNKRFSKILTKGKVVPSGPLAAEANESEAAYLPRLVMNFDRRSYGHLYKMIDFINECCE
jgi:uncharacterized protein (TIGR00730 family)